MSVQERKKLPLESRMVLHSENLKDKTFNFLKTPKASINESKLTTN